MDILFQLIIAIGGIIGATLVSFNNVKHQLNGYVCWVFANGIGIWFFAEHEMWVLMWQFIIYSAVSIYGIYERTKK